MFCDMTYIYCLIMYFVIMFFRIMYYVMYLYHKMHQYGVLSDLRHPIDAQFQIHQLCYRREENIQPSVNLQSTNWK